MRRALPTVRGLGDWGAQASADGGGPRPGDGRTDDGGNQVHGPATTTAVVPDAVPVDTLAAPYEPPSWEQIVAEHSARVYRLAYRLTGNPYDAEDLTQETFIRVFRSLSSYTPGTFEGWLHRITTNLFLDQVRRRRRIRMEPLGDDAQHVANPVGPGSPERGFEHANLDQDVQRALDALSPEFRAAVVLCDIEGLSYEEIAVTLGVKLGTVRSRIHRARAQLRDSLAHRAPSVPEQYEATRGPQPAGGRA
jgi:RNA polymerase sigma-70 factor (ECF subfamily)